MKITKIHITSFGKLRDYTLELKDGFNVIYGENEYGKSTLMAFIAMIFYGKPASSKGGSDIMKNMRKRYEPWTGEKMDGSIEFISGDDTYRVEKTWGKSEKSDKIRVYKNGTQEVHIAQGEDVGSMFFGMDAEAFERSIYIGDECIFNGNGNGDLIAEKISNISTAGDENISTEKVMKKLLSEKEELISKSGRTGEVVKLREEIEELGNEYKRIRSVEQEQKEAKERYAKVAESIKEIKYEQENIEKKIHFQELEELINLENSFNEQKENICKYMELVDMSGFVSENELLLNKASQELSYEEKQNITEEILSRGREIEPNVKNISSRKEEAQKTYNVLENKLFDEDSREADEKESQSMMIPAVVIAIISVGLGVIVNPVLFAGIIIAVVFVLISNNNKRKKENISKNNSNIIKNEIEAARNNFNNLEKELHSSETEMEKFLEAYDVLNVDEMQKKYIDTEKKNAIAKQHNEEVINARNIFTTNMAKIGAENEYVKATEQFEKFKKSRVYVSELNKDLVAKKRAYEYEEYTLSELIEEQIKCSDFAADDTLKSESDISALKMKYKANERTLSGLYTEQRMSAEQIREVEKNPETILRELKEKQDILLELEYSYKVLDIAHKVMEETINEIRQSFGPELNEKTAGILSKITKGKYEETMVHKDYKVQVMGEDDSHFREYGYLSTGTVNQIYLALRLAIVELIEDKEKMPLFMDDILASYDDERAKKAIEYFKEYGETGQIIMFTCHGFIKDMA